MNYDLFGNIINEKTKLRNVSIEPNFSILEANTALWRNKKRKYLALGIKSELGRNVKTFKEGFKTEKGIINYKYAPSDTSVFDPYLCEILLRWFCPENGNILDPFAGGSVRGIIAHYLGYKYTGIDIRKEQIDDNVKQAINILPINNQPQWVVGDSNKLLDKKWSIQFDMIFSCPPYANLEVYSDLPGDISNKPYKEFLIFYESIIKKSCNQLKKGAYACFVVGEVRDKNGFYIGFVPDTIKAFEKCGMKFYNEIIYKNELSTAAIRARKYFINRKVVKIHQNVLVFKKK